MKLLSVGASKIDLLVMLDRRYCLDSPVTMCLHTDTGDLVYSLRSGYITDGRSGGPVVDLLLPNVGDEHYRRCWLCHDSAFSLGAECISETSGIPFPSFELANDLFRQQLKLPRKLGGAGLPPWKAWAAWEAVSSWLGRGAYDTTDADDRRNFGKVEIEWTPLFHG